MDVNVYGTIDLLSGALLFAMVVFSPWALGTTQPWSIWTMNISGYALGAGLLVKLGVRYLRGYAPPRWAHGPSSVSEPGRKIRTTPTGLLAWLTLLILAWCLASAWNARAVFDNRSLSFEYHDAISWLPHSFDRDASWAAFWKYLGLACTFWAARDWLLGKTLAEQRTGRGERNYPGIGDRQGGSRRGPLLPGRLRRLLWLMAINGALIGLEAIVQRSANSPELLFLVKPRIHQTAEGQFGPYAYRSNAAQFFNLLWPVCLGFWWMLNRNAPSWQKKHHLLLVGAALMAASAIISSSRAGAMIAVALAVAAAIFLLFADWALPDNRRSAGKNPGLRTVTFCLGAALVLGLGLGWKTLAPRMEEMGEGFAGREQLYQAARPIANDYPVFGTGPGTFETLSQLYPRPDIFWPSQLHNDWLETRITFGGLGSALIAAAFVCLLLCWSIPGGIHGGRRFVVLTWLALGGCLLHARYDFPFQIHSTLFLFLLICSILSTLSRRAV